MSVLSCADANGIRAGRNQSVTRQWKGVYVQRSLTGVLLWMMPAFALAILCVMLAKSITRYDAAVSEAACRGC